MFGGGISQAIQPAIKSIARYNFDMSGSDMLKNTTISAVDLTKSIIFPVEVLTTSPSQAADVAFNCKLPSTTLARVTRPGENVTFPLFVGALVVEFWDLKSLQEVSISNSYPNTAARGNQGTINYVDTTISSVNTAKTLIIPTGVLYPGTAAGGLRGIACHSKELTSSTNLRSWTVLGSDRIGNEKCYLVEIR